MFFFKLLVLVWCVFLALSKIRETTGPGEMESHLPTKNPLGFKGWFESPVSRREFRFAKCQETQYCAQQSENPVES